MTNEIERVWKEAVVTQFLASLTILAFAVDIEENRDKTVRTAGLRAEI
jgi:hypothetical protein